MFNTTGKLVERENTIAGNVAMLNAIYEHKDLIVAASEQYLKDVQAVRPIPANVVARRQKQDMEEASQRAAIKAWAQTPQEKRSAVSAIDGEPSRKKIKTVPTGNGIPENEVPVDLEDDRKMPAIETNSKGNMEQILSGDSDSDSEDSFQLRDSGDQDMDRYWIEKYCWGAMEPRGHGTKDKDASDGS